MQVAFDALQVVAGGNPLILEQQLPGEGVGLEQSPDWRSQVGWVNDPHEMQRRTREPHQGFCVGERLLR